MSSVRDTYRAVQEGAPQNPIPERSQTFRAGMRNLAVIQKPDPILAHPKHRFILLLSNVLIEKSDFIVFGSNRDRLKVRNEVEGTAGSSLLKFGNPCDFSRRILASWQIVNPFKSRHKSRAL